MWLLQILAQLLIGFDGPLNDVLEVGVRHTVVERQVDDTVHEPLGILTLLITGNRLHVAQLGGSSVSVDASLVQVLSEQNLIGNYNGEEPIGNDISMVDGL